MAKLRALLMVFMTACAVSGYKFVYSGWQPLLTEALTIVVGILFFVAFFVLVLSFLNMEVTPEGELSYDPNNFFWSCLEEIGGGSLNNLCKLYWAAVGLVILVCLFVLLVSLVVFAVGYFIYFEPLAFFLIVLAVLVVIGLVKSAFRYVPLLGKTLVGQMIINSKKALCPKIIRKS